MYRQVRPYTVSQQLERTLWYWGTMATLGWAALGLVNALSRTATAILEAGWGKTLSASEPLAVLTACALNTPCASNLELIPRAYDRVLYLGPFVLFAALGVLAQVFKRYPTYKPVAAGRWATRSELRKYLEPKLGLVGYLGLIPTRELLPRAFQALRALAVPEDEWSEHALVFGPPGSGKTVGFFRPTLYREARAGRSTVVFDVKHGDLRQGLGAVINEFRAFERHVAVFTPYAEHSRSLDLFQGCESLEKATQVASIFVPVPAVRGEGAFYEDQERMLLAALLVDGKLKGGVRLDQIRMRLKSGVAPLKNYILHNAHLEAELATLLGFNQDRLTGIMNGLAGKLEPFSRGNLPGRLAGVCDPLDLEMVFLEPSLFYIGIPQVDVYGGHGALLMQLVYRVVNETGLRIADRHGGRVPVGVSVCLDELLNLGRLEGVQNMLAMMRSRGIAYLLGVQGHDEGRAKYTKDTWEAIVKLCRHKIVFLGALDPKDALETTKLLGEMTVFEQSVAESDGDNGDRRGTTTREAKRALVSPEEMVTWAQFQAVVFSRYTAPWRAAFYPLFDPRHPDHREHAALNVCIQTLSPLEFLAQSSFPAVSPIPSTDPAAHLETARLILRAVRASWRCELYREPKRVARVRLEPILPFDPPHVEGIVWDGQTLEINALENISEVFVNALVWLQRRTRVEAWLVQHATRIKGRAEFAGEPVGELEGTTLWMPADAASAILGKTHLQRKRIEKRVMDGCELEVVSVALAFPALDRLENGLRALEPGAKREPSDPS